LTSCKDDILVVCVILAGFQVITSVGVIQCMYTQLSFHNVV